MTAEQKVRIAIQACGTTGTTVAELSEQLALDRELVYKIQDRLSVDIKNMDDRPDRPLLRTIEFFGRERRLRLFTRAAWAARMAQRDKDVVMLSSPSGLSARSSATSLTLASRQEVIQRLLRDNPILEIGRPLADRIHKELNLPHTLDTKTVKRTAGLMEAAGLVQRLDIVTGRGAQFKRSIIHCLGDNSDPRLLAYIKRVKEGLIAEDKPVLPNEGLSSISFTRSMFAVDQLGMVNGTMARARILHAYLWDSFESVDTLEALFKQLPFGLYRRLIGLAGTPINAKGKPESLPDPQTPLEALPDIWRQTINTRSSRHRYIIRLLLGILEAVGALKACHDTIYGLDEQSLTAWRLGPDALQYARLSGMASKKFRYPNSPRLPPSFVVQRNFAISGEAFAEPALLWEFLESRKEKQAGDFTEEQGEASTPQSIVLALARCSTSWSQKRDVQRSLRHALRRAILDEHSKKTITQREFVPIRVWRLDCILSDSVLGGISAEHGIDSDLCKKTLDEMKQAHLAREAHRRVALTGTSSGITTPAARDNGVEDVDGDGEQLQADIVWTDELNELLLLGYHLLATDRRFWIAHRRTINWSLLDPILFPGAPAQTRTHRMESARRHVIYLTRNIRWRKRYYAIANAVAATSTIDSIDLGEHIRHHQMSTSDCWWEVENVQYATLSPLEKCSKETHRRCIEEIHPILSDPPYIEWPEGKEELVSCLLRALVHDIGGKQDKAVRQLLASNSTDAVVEWMKSVKLLAEYRKGDRKLAALPNLSVGPALEWILDANSASCSDQILDFTKSWSSATDEQFGRLLTLVSRNQLKIRVSENSGNFEFVDARPKLNLRAFACRSRHSMLCHDDGSMDVEMLQRVTSVVRHRFERDYALSATNLSFLSPVLKRVEVESILEFLVDQRFVKPAMLSTNAATVFYHLNLFDLQ